jgi:YbgC/YbaW family acyl-CoA thioester hydrolase
VLTFSRPVRFEEVDAAGIVFFARYLHICHDAMEAVFDPLPGGYRALITERRVGFPAVHTECDFAAPLRYGDIVRVETKVVRIGETSVTFAFTLVRTRDEVVAAKVTHTTVVCSLDTMEKTKVPDDVRAVLTAHLSP